MRGGAPGPQTCSLGSMRLTEFHQLVQDEFGSGRAQWIIQSQVLPGYEQTSAELIDGGLDPRYAWQGLCEAFDIPEERRLGVDRPGY